MKGQDVGLDSLDEVAELARYTRLENVPSIVAFPNAEELDTTTVARLLGWEAERLQTVQDTLRAAVRRAARELLEDDRFARAARGLPFAAGDVVLAIGDSITSDAVSWAEIVAAVLERVRPGEIRLVNAAVSGDTSADLIARFHTIAAYRPSWLLVMIGTNDARRHGPGGVARMTSLGETQRNLSAFAALVERQAGARLVLLTPPPISETRMRHHRRWTEERITWRAAEVSEVADAVRRDGELVVDVHGALSGAAAGLTADGVHPTLAGQQQIAKAIVIELAEGV